jgi:hypothetical protein
MTPILTEDQLNSCLLAINHGYKAGDFSNNIEQSLEINNQLVTFTFDRKLGRRGSWIPKTNIKVLYKQDDDPSKK